MLRVLAACVVLVAAFPRGAEAEWHFTPMIGSMFFGKTSLLDHDHTAEKAHRNFGGSVALLGDGIVGVEGLVALTPGFLTADPIRIVKRSWMVAVAGNVVLTTPKRWTEYTLRPFVSGGFGVNYVSETEVAAVFAVHNNIPSFDIGGGAIGFLTQRTGLRFDLRFHSSLARSYEGLVAVGPVHLRYMTASVGVVLRR